MGGKKIDFLSRGQRSHPVGETEISVGASAGIEELLQVTTEVLGHAPELRS